jgi:hypothetical protein
VNISGNSLVSIPRAVTVKTMSTNVVFAYFFVLKIVLYINEICIQSFGKFKFKFNLNITGNSQVFIPKNYSDCMNEAYECRFCIRFFVDDSLYCK